MRRLPRRQLITLIFAGVAIILLPIIFLQLFRPNNSAAAWYNTQWSTRKLLTIDAGQVAGSADHTNFPVLVSITDSDLAANAQADGDDILFTSSDGVTELDHEIESYNSGTGVLVAWVRIPTLDYDNNTTLYMYFGNSSVSSQENVTGVWDSNYLGVWHMEETSTNTVADSTSNANHGTNNGATETTSSSVGYALDFASADTDYVDIGTMNALDGLTSITWEIYASVDDTAADHGLFARGGAGTLDLLLWRDENTSCGANRTDTFSFLVMNSVCGTAERVMGASGSWNDTNYHYLAAVYDGSGPRLRGYIDGSEDANSPAGTSSPSTYPTSGDNVWIGARGGTTAYNLDGKVTEARISTAIRSADWISTTYNNLNAPGTFLSVGASEVTPDALSPIANWSLDEGYGPTAQESVTDDDGTISGAVWKTEDLCVSGKCLYFDGTDDTVTVSNTIAGVQSVSFWVRPISTTEQFLALNGSAYITASSGTVSATGFTSPTIYVNGKESSTIVANRWQHIMVTTGTAISASAITLGNQSTNYGQIFLDEVKLYNSTLTATQVTQDYNGGAVVAGRTNQKFLSDGLVGYWKMDETSTPTGDQSGNGNNGTWNGNTTTIAGKFGTANDFDGTDDYLEIADPGSGALDFGNSDFSISGWFNRDTFTGTDTIVAKKTGAGTNEGYLIVVESTDELTFSVADGTDTYNISTSAFATTTGWNHVVAVFDEDSDTGSTIYINGIQDEAATVGTLSSIDSINSTNNLTIGVESDIGGDCDCKIDEIRIYNRALSSSEATTLYNWAPGPVAYWNMDENTGTNLYDKSGNGHNSSSFSSAPAWVSGKVGSALDFDGTDDYVSMTSSSQFKNTNEFSIMGWFQWDGNADTYEHAVSYYDPDNSDQGFILGQHFMGTPGLRVFNGVGSGDTTVRLSSFPSTGTWHHFAAVFKSGNSIKLYLNGVEQSTTISGSNYLVTYGFDVDPAFRIGARSDGSPADSYLAGKADEVKLYNYARTSGQIVEDMNGGHPIGGSPIASQLVYWNFDEQQGQTTNNSGYGSSNGTLGTNSSASTDDPAWKTKADCKINGCLDFDGGDYVQTASGVDLSNKSFTATVWAKRDGIGGLDMIFGQGSQSTREGLHIGFRDSNQFSCALYSDDLDSTATYTDTDWHHWACVYNADTNKMSLYRDGRFVEDHDTSGDYIGTGTFYIGRTGWGDSHFNGNVDEIKIYTAALTANEVALDFNNGSVLAFGTTTSDEQTQDIGAGDPPLAYWDFNEKADNTCAGGTNDLCDKSGNGLDGANTNGPVWTQGKTGSALDFDGTNDYVSLGTGVDVSSETSVSIFAWVYANDATTDYQGVISQTNEAGGQVVYQLGIGVTNSVWRVRLHTGGGTGGEGVTYEFGTINLNQWDQIGFVFDGTNVYTYQNGVLQTTTARTAALTTTPYHTSIGRYQHDGAGGYEYFDGKIDEVKVYDYARSQAQIAYDYNRGGPVGHWQLDECTGTTAYDASGNGNNGTITPGASGNTAAGTCDSGTSTEMWNDGTDGKINGSLGFDGTNDYVDIPSTSSINFNYNVDFSVSTWVKTSSTDINTAIVEKWAGSNGYPYVIRINNGSVDGKIFVARYDGTNNPSIKSTQTLNDNTWHFVVFTKSGSTLSLYINGKLDSTTTDTTSTTTTNSSSLYLGTRGATGNYYSGLIDDVRVYNYTLSAAQVRKIMNDNSGVRFGPSSGQP